MDTTRKRFPVWRWIAIVLVVLVLILGLLVGGWMVSRSRTFQLFGEIVHRVETDEKVVALTFDDGPTPEYTDGVLAVLRDRGIKATFYLVGQDVEAHGDETRAIIAAGHELGNHTYTHNDMTLVDEATAAREVETTDAALRAAGYQGEITFRAPYTKKLWGLPLYLSKHDRVTVSCDIEPESDKALAADADKMAANVIEQARPGSIILLHVMYPVRETSRQALPAIIDGLKQKGFRFVTVSELLALRDA